MKNKNKHLVWKQTKKKKKKKKKKKVLFQENQLKNSSHNLSTCVELFSFFSSPVYFV